MAEYISRESAYTLAKKIADAVHSGEYSSIQLPHFILDAIDDIPTADVREVIYCRDCDCGKDCYIKTILTEDCEIEEPFCAAGEKREES